MGPGGYGGMCAGGMGSGKNRRREREGGGKGVWGFGACDSGWIGSLRLKGDQCA